MKARKKAQSKANKIEPKNNEVLKIYNPLKLKIKIKQ